MNKMEIIKKIEELQFQIGEGGVLGDVWQELNQIKTEVNYLSDNGFCFPPTAEWTQNCVDNAYDLFLNWIDMTEATQAFIKSTYDTDNETYSVANTLNELLEEWSPTDILQLGQKYDYSTVLDYDYYYYNHVTRELMWTDNIRDIPDFDKFLFRQFKSLLPEWDKYLVDGKPCYPNDCNGAFLFDGLDEDFFRDNNF